MRIAITGATGLIGSFILKHLEGLNDHELKCLTRQTVMAGKSSHVKWISGDLTDYECIKNFISHADCIFHLAHNSIPLGDCSFSRGMITNPLEININLIKAISETSNKPHIIYFSSGGAIYGDWGGIGYRYSETDRCEPITNYGIQKLTIERLFHQAAMLGIINCTVLRVSNAYGLPLNVNKLQGLIGNAISRVMNGQPLRLIGSINNVRDYIHVDDIANVSTQLLQTDQKYRVFNVGSGEGVTVGEIFKIIMSEIGEELPVFETIAEGQQLLPTSNILNINKLQSELNWRPSITLSEAIRQMVLTYRNTKC